MTHPENNFRVFPRIVPRLSAYRIIQLVICVALLIPSIAEAAALTPLASQSQYRVGDIFIVDLRLDSQGEYINAVEASLSFDPLILNLEEVSRGDSILTLWVEEPGWSNQSGELKFTGGTPNGFEGKNGLLARVVFRAVNSGATEIKFLNEAQALLNDGLGSPAKLTSKRLKLNIEKEEPGAEKLNEWQGELTEDNISPESFIIYLRQEAGYYDDKYFIVFSTTDKQSGVDHYEIKEGKADWRAGQSPFVLRDQSLKGEISVKAVDKAGNERIEIIYPQAGPIAVKLNNKIVKVILSIFAVAFFVILCYFLIKKVKFFKR